MIKIWKNWLKVTKRIVNVQANILLSILYVVLLIPLGFLLQTFFKKTLLGHGFNLQKNTHWIKREKVKHDIKFAHEQ